MITEFFDSLFRLKHPDHWIEMRAITNTKELVRKAWAQDTAGLLSASSQASSGEGLNVYFGVLPRVFHSNGTKESTQYGSTVWIDLDSKDFDGSKAKALRVLKSFNIPPTWIVDSGNGYHAYWCLEENIDAKRIEVINRGLVDTLGGDNAWDCAHILRVPGTLNFKHEPFSTVQVKHSGPLAASESFLAYEEIGRPLISRVSGVDRGVYVRLGESAPSDGPVCGLTKKWQRLIEEGIAADDFGDYVNKATGRPDRDRLDFACCLYLLSQACTPEEIVAVFTNPQNGISSKTLEKPEREQERYLNNLINNALNTIKRQQKVKA